MTRLEKVMLSALENAESIMDYCAGDAWERECTEKDRNEFERSMKLIRKKLKIGEFSLEAIEKREKEEAAAKKAEEYTQYWLVIEHKCPFCGLNKKFCREDLAKHLNDKHGEKLTGPKWRMHARKKFEELGI